MVTKAQKPAVEVSKADESITAQARKVFEGVIASFNASQLDVDVAKGKLDGETERHGGVRVQLLTSLADAAVTGKWTHKYALQGIEAAIAAFEKGRNGVRATTLRQFATECGRAIHPKAREHVKAAFTEATSLWDAESKAVENARNEAKDAGEKFVRKDVPTPLHDTFKRKYHMVVGSNGLLAARADKDEAKAALADSPDMLADRVQRDERTNPNKAKRAIDRALATLEEIAAEFPHHKWETVITFLEGMNVADLTKARDKALAEKRNASNIRKRNVTVSDEANDATDELIDE